MPKTSIRFVIFFLCAAFLAACKDRKNENLRPDTPHSAITLNQYEETKKDSLPPLQTEHKALPSRNEKSVDKVISTGSKRIDSVAAPTIPSEPAPIAASDNEERRDSSYIHNPLLRDLIFDNALIFRAMTSVIREAQKPPDSLKWEDIVGIHEEVKPNPDWMKALGVIYKVFTAVGFIFLIFFNR